MQKKLYGLASLLSLGSLISCATGGVPDVPVCVEFSPDRGRCVHVISGKDFVVDEVNKFQSKTWWEQRPAMILVPASSWAEIKSFIIKSCKKSNACQDQLSSWDRTVDKIDVNINKKLLTNGGKE